MFYYFSIEDGKIGFVHRVDNVPVDEFYEHKKDAEAKNPSIKYEIVPVEMEPLADYAVEMKKRAVDCDEIRAQIATIKEAIDEIEWEIK